MSPSHTKRLPTGTSCSLQVFFFRKQESGELRLLSGPRGHVCGIHHSLWLSYTSARLKVKAITGLSLQARPGASPLLSALLSMIVHLCCSRLTHLSSVSPPRHSLLFPLPHRPLLPSFLPFSLLSIMSSNFSSISARFCLSPWCCAQLPMLSKIKVIASSVCNVNCLC